MATRFPSTFLAAIAGYPIILNLLSLRSKQNISPRLDYQLRLKLVSSLHAIIASIVALNVTLDPKWTKPDSNLIYTPHSRAVSLAGLESGYLLQDMFALLYESQVLGGKLNGLMMFHHAAIGGGLAMFLELCARGRQLGSYFIAMFILMNASTPLLHVRWALQKGLLRTTPRRSAGVDMALIITFFTCRIYLIYYMLRTYGRRIDMSMWNAFKSIPLQCKLGLITLLGVNGAWWIELCAKTYQRHLKGKTRK